MRALQKSFNQNIPMKKISLTIVFLLIAATASALEFQWKFTINSMDNRETGVKVYEALDSINGVYDIEVNFERNTVMFFLNDDKTDEEKVLKSLKADGFVVDKVMLLEEPREGVMN